jgi:hypothetical protein
VIAADLDRTCRARNGARPLRCLYTQPICERSERPGSRARVATVLVSADLDRKCRARYRCRVEVPTCDRSVERLQLADDLFVEAVNRLRRQWMSEVHDDLVDPKVALASDPVEERGALPVGLGERSFDGDAV